MRIIFVDTSHYVAILDPTDDLHDRAVSVLQALFLEPVLFITSESVLLELLAYMSRRGARLREAAAQLARDALSGAGIEVVPATRRLMLAAIDRHERRSDKTYSLADCIAMEICEERGITDVLTSDKDFEQEGFTRLLVAPA